MKRVVRQGIKAGAAALSLAVPGAAGLTVLIYHRVGAGSGLEVDLPVSLFDEQMAWLASTARLVPLGEGVEEVTSGRAAAGLAPVAVTFDDGTADFAANALPVLTRYDIPVTLYVATDFVNSGRAFPDDGPPLTWDEVRACAVEGRVTIGSHTHTHALLDRCDGATARDELDRSIALIGEELGSVPDHFAYPKALLGNEDARRAVGERFRTAAVAGTRANPYGRTDPLALRRSPIQVSDAMTWFRQKATGQMRAEDGLRQVLNRRRYAGATT